MNIRRALALPMAMLLVFSFAGIASAHIESKSIVTEAGECWTEGTPECDAAAIYGPNGFTGTITFSADEIGDTVRIVDYMCVHTTAGGAFLSYGGSYTLTLTEGGATIGTDTYTVANGQECVDGNVAVASAEGAVITVPNDGTVTYTITIAGVTAGTSAQTTFSGYNSIRNRAFDQITLSHADSISVKPPTTFIVPETPLAALLVLTSGLLAAAYVVKRQRPTPAARAG